MRLRRQIRATMMTETTLQVVLDVNSFSGAE